MKNLLVELELRLRLAGSLSFKINTFHENYYIMALPTHLKLMIPGDVRTNLSQLVLKFYEIAHFYNLINLLIFYNNRKLI